MNPTATRKRVAVLISGRGSNMQALVEAAAAPGFPAKIATVISNRPDAAGLLWAADQGIATVALDHKAHPDRAAFDAKLHETLKAADIDLVALAGFMRILTPGFVASWQGRMINIHPSLLPLFPGLDTHARAIEAGVKIAGCTAHFVTAEMDVGPIIVQAAVPVGSDDTPATLADRVLAAEHRIYPQALEWVAGDRVTFETVGTACYGSAGLDTRLISPAATGG
ncbi:MAG: phosphoribosylglycinamide formyltransferase [Hyphomicrobiaceae bacterium]